MTSRETKDLEIKEPVLYPSEPSKKYLLGKPPAGKTFTLERDNPSRRVPTLNQPPVFLRSVINCRSQITLNRRLSTFYR